MYVISPMLVVPAPKYVEENLEYVFRDLPKFSTDDHDVKDFIILLKQYATSLSKTDGKIDLEMLYKKGIGDAVRPIDPQKYFSNKNLSGLGLKKEISTSNGLHIMTILDTMGTIRMEYKLTEDFEWKEQFINLLKNVNYSFYEMDDAKRKYLDRYGDLYNYAHQVSQLRALKITPKQAIIVLNGERQYRRQERNEQKLLKKTLSNNDIGLPNTYDKFLPSYGVYRGGKERFVLYPAEQKRFFSQTRVRGRVLHPGGGTISSNSSVAFDSTFIVDPLYNGGPEGGYRGTYKQYVNQFGKSALMGFGAICSDACGYMMSQDVFKPDHNTRWMKSMHPQITNDITAGILSDIYDIDFQKDKFGSGASGIKRVLMKVALEENYSRIPIFSKFKYKIMSKQRASNLEVILDCFDKRFFKGGREMDEIMQFVASVVYVGNIVRRNHGSKRTGPAKFYDMDDSYYNAYFEKNKRRRDFSSFTPPDNLDALPEKKGVIKEDESEDFFPLGYDYTDYNIDEAESLYEQFEELMN